jgi:hypothetical protein
MTARALAIIGLIVFLGCNATPPRVPATTELEGLPDVAVELAPEIGTERTAVFERYDGRARLRNALLDELITTGKGRSLGADRVVLTVTKFRLRSTGAGVWLGAFAGADMMDATADLQKDGATIRQLKNGTGGITAGLIKPSADGRFNGLVKELAKRLVAQM